MNIGIDLDEVTADFRGMVLRKLREKYNVSLSPEQWSEYHLEDVPALKETPQIALNAIDDVYNEGLMKELDLLPGAKLMIEKLAERHTVLFVTARGRHFARAKSDTLYWLQKHSIPFHGLHMEHNKHTLAKELKIDVFIEDSPFNAEAIANESIPVLLMDKPFNRKVNHPLIARVYSWREVELEIEKMENKGKEEILVT